MTLLDPGALSSATACLTASLRSCRVSYCTDLHSSGTPRGMWALTSPLQAGRFTGRLAYGPAAHWWLSGNVKSGLIWGSVVQCNVFVLVCCAFCMLGNVH